MKEGDVPSPSYDLFSGSSKLLLSLIFYSLNDSVGLIVLNWDSRVNQFMQRQSSSSKGRKQRSASVCRPAPLCSQRKKLCQPFCMHHPLHIILLVLFADNTSALLCHLLLSWFIHSAPNTAILSPFLSLSLSSQSPCDRLLHFFSLPLCSLSL